jgi:Uma2 family endonuclease
MMTGMVTAGLQPKLELELRGPSGVSQKVEAVIDTGFDGELVLPRAIIRAPAVSFVARGKLKRYEHGGEPIPATAPDLAVEVSREDNTGAEMARKMEEYFAAGTRLAWVVDPKTETVRVHREPRKFVVLRVGDVLDGGDVIPGLRIPVQDLFELEDD